MRFHKNAFNVLDTIFHKTSIQKVGSASVASPGTQTTTKTGGRPAGPQEWMDTTGVRCPRTSTPLGANTTVRVSIVRIPFRNTHRGNHQGPQCRRDLWQVCKSTLIVSRLFKWVRVISEIFKTLFSSEILGGSRSVVWCDPPWFLIVTVVVYGLFGVERLLMQNFHFSSLADAHFSRWSIELSIWGCKSRKS